MPKTYSVAIQTADGTWITNWHEFFNLDDIDFDKVKEFCQKRGDKAYGHYYGNNSRNLVSARCRTVVQRIEYEAIKEQ